MANKISKSEVLCTVETCWTDIIPKAKTKKESSSTMLCTVETCSTDVIPKAKKVKDIKSQKDNTITLDIQREKKKSTNIFKIFYGSLFWREFEEEKRDLETDIAEDYLTLQQLKGKEQQDVLKKEIDIKETQLEIMETYGENHRQDVYLDLLREKRI